MAGDVVGVELPGVYRGLSAARQDAFLPDLAGSLNNQGMRLNDLERWDESLAVDEETVHLYRALAEARPDAFLPGLANSLANLAIDLRAIGQREEALTASKEAIRAVVPLLERAPSALSDAGLPLLRRYVGLCEEMEREPDEEILQRMYQVLVSAGVLTGEDEA